MQFECQWGNEKWSGKITNFTDYGTIMRSISKAFPLLGFYPEQVADYPQAMVMLSDPDQALPGLPVRYCFDYEASDPSFIPFYKFNGDTLERVDLS